MSKIEIKTPDFRYPTDVVKDANATLKDAIAQRDGNAIIASLVQIGLAKTAVSRNNTEEVCRQIDEVIAKDGLLTPDMLALAYLLKSDILDKAPSDVDVPEGMKTEWSRVIDPLGNGDVSALMRPLTDYTDLIVPGNNWGNRCIPTLYDFLMMRVANETSMSYEKRQQWLTMHMTDQDIMPRLFIEQYIARGGYYATWRKSMYIQPDDVSLYEKYASYPESALFIICDYPEDKDYPVFKDYLKRHPDYELSQNVKTLLSQIEATRVALSYPSLVQSTDPIKVSADARNVNDFTITLYRINKEPESRSVAELNVADFTVVQTRTVHAEGQIPFNAQNLEVTFDPVPYGHYIALASYRSEGSEHAHVHMREEQVYSSMINVSDIRTFCITPSQIVQQNGKDQLIPHPVQVFAVNSQTGAPIVDAKVSYKEDSYRSRSKDDYKDGLTNKEGYLTIPRATYITYSITKDNDCSLPEYREYVAGNNQTFQKTGLDIHTDLGIYRPGETVRFSVIAWHAGYFKGQPSASVKLNVSFNDASGNEIDTKKLTTDGMGQAVAEFQIPTDRMNGKFSIRIHSEGGNLSYSATRYIDVSEYKTPTFWVDLSATDPHQLDGQPVRVKGRIMTYSGMPVADTEVNCRLSARSWWWYDDSASFNAHNFTVTTDKGGNFEYICPAEWLESRSSASGRRPFYTYSILATCTNAAGETHQGNCEFWIGNARGLNCSEGTFCLQPGTPVSDMIQLVTSDPAEKSVRCHYELSRVQDQDTVLVKAEDFASDDQHFNWDKVPSGEYILEAYIIGDEEAEKGKSKVTLYRETDALPPVVSSLFIVEKSTYIDEKGHVRILLGNSHTNHYYYVIEDRSHVLKSGWIQYEPGMHWFTAEMPMEADQCLNIHFYTVYQGKSYDKGLHFSSPIRDEVQLSAVSFRDKIQPGQTEHWTFRLTDQAGNPVAGGRMLLELYNEALESLAPNSWHLHTSRYMYSMHQHHHPQYRGTSSMISHQAANKYAAAPTIKLPAENLYGHSFFSPVMQSTRAYRGGGVYAASGMPDVMELAVMEDAAPVKREVASPMMKSMANVAEDEEEVVQSAAKDNIAIRADEVKVALWRPQLTADGEGNFSVEFDVPNYNTTYRFQALAYNATICTSTLSKKVLAQRSVMVQPSLPRFLRTGDSIELAANVMNATDSLMQVEAIIELFDPRTHEILKSSTVQLALEALATEVVRIVYAAPQDAPYVGFRVKALAADGNGDGEQQMIPVLSNITPVIETQPFYMQPVTPCFGLDVLAPALSAEGSRLTLEYCNNPTWYCVTALPSIIDADAITSPALAHNLFALSLTAKLSAENPLLADAIRSWKQKQGQEGDILVSPLQQNEDLKISPLLASPWLPEAVRQQLRMQALDQLFDQERNERLTTKLITALQRLQAKDGGFLWLDFDGSRREASYWATAQVLELLGELNQLGCLPASPMLRNLIADALHYYDAETLEMEAEILNAAKKMDYKPSYLSFWTYIYVRKMLADIAGYSSKSQGKDIFKLTDKTLNELEKNWGELPMTSRAQAAVTLKRYGREAKARGVIESVRQFALHDPVKGMYWESLERSGFYPVACTSAMLQAFAEVSPRQEEIDEMRQWLLLEKQTTDWGSSSMAIDAVYAILSTGSDWLHASSADSIPQFQILVDGKPVDVSDTDRHLGYIRMSLPVGTKRVEVTRTGVNPAWGSLYHQFRAPMTEVEAKGVDELTIEKQMLRIDADGKSQKLSVGDTLRVGDRIRTTLRIKATRDMEYVTIVDQRPAFLEPVDQTSHYTRADHFYYYLETKDAQTNAFISYMPDGLHTVSYDSYVTASGTFTSGIATIQSQFAPQFVAHSAGASINTQK